MNTSKLITLGVVGAVLLFLWDWVTNGCETPGSSLYGGSICNAMLGTPITGTIPQGTTPVNTPAQTVQTTQTAQPVVTPQATLGGALLSAAGFSSNTQELSPDQWSYYYQAIPGKPQISGPKFEDILTSMGLTDATRSTQVTANAFAQALSQNGLSGSRVPMSAIHEGWA